MARRHAIPALACVFALLLVATARVWHHDHHEPLDETSCAVCHAVLESGQRDVPAPTVVNLEPVRVQVLAIAQDSDPATRFVQHACARGPPAPVLA